MNDTHLDGVDLDAEQLVREVSVEPERVRGVDVFSLGLLGQDAGADDATGQGLQGAAQLAVFDARLLAVWCACCAWQSDTVVSCVRHIGS
jgi:hypothetical protein